MNRRELARREALAVWLASFRSVYGEGDITSTDLREAELRFDAWWSRTTRRQLLAGD